MSQVRKYKTGGTTQKKPVGKFVMDGKEYSLDNEDFTKQFTDFTHSLPQEQRMHMADVWKSLEKGETVTYNSRTNELSANVQFSGLNERQNKKMTEKGGTWWDALINGRKQNAHKTVDALRGFNYIEPSKVVEKPNLKDVNFVRSVIDYNTDPKDKTGKTKYFSNNPTNQSILDRITNLQDYFGLGDEGKNKYKISGIDEDGVRSYNTNTPTGLSTILERIKSNTLDDQDWDVLNSLNIHKNDENNSSRSTGTGNQSGTVPSNSTPTDNYKKLGVDGSYSGGRFGLTFDENGNPIISNHNGISLINDWSPFDKSSPWFGGAIVGNTLFSRKDLENNRDNIQQKLELARQFANQGKFNEIKSTGVNYWWDKAFPFQQYNPDTQHLDQFYEHLKKDSNGRNPWIFNLGSEYYVPEGAAGIGYFDSDTQRDHITGMPIKMNYRFYDPYRKNTQQGHDFSYSNPDEFNNIYRKREVSDEDPANALKISPYLSENYKGSKKYAVIDNIQTGDLDENGIGTGSLDIARGPDGRLYVKTSNNDYYLIEDYDLYDKLVNKKEPVARDQIEKLYKSQVLYADGKHRQARFTPFTPNPLQSYTKDGYKLYSDWATWLAGKDKEKEAKIGKRKMQYGGTFSRVNKTNVTNDINKTNVEGLSDITKSAKYSEFRKDGAAALTSADKWELGAIAGDLASTVGSFIPGANFVSAGVGVGATGSQFVADVKRDGLDWGDVGRGLGNLGLDVLTFIPGVGAGAKSLKAVRAIRRGASTIGRAFALWNMPDAAGALKKIVSGEDWSLDDLRLVATGLQGTLGIGRSVSRRIGNAALRTPQAKLPKGTALVNSNKYGEVQLSKKELDNLPTTGKNRTEKLNELLEQKIKSNNVKIDDGDKSKLVELFNLDKNTNWSKIRHPKNADNRTLKRPEAIKQKGFLYNLMWNGKDGINLRGGLKSKNDLSNYRLDNGEVQGWLPKQLQKARQRAYMRNVVENPDKFGDKYVVGTRNTRITGKEVPVYGNIRRGNMIGTIYNNYSRQGKPMKLSDELSKYLLKNKKANFKSNIVYNPNFKQKPKVVTPQVTEQLTIPGFKKGGRIQKFLVGGGIFTPTSWNLPNVNYVISPEHNNGNYGNSAFKKNSGIGSKGVAGNKATTTSTPTKRLPVLSEIPNNIHGNDFKLSVPGQYTGDDWRQGLKGFKPLTNQYSESGRQGWFKNLPKIKLDRDDLASYGSLALQQIFNNRTAKVKAKGIRDAMLATESSPQEVYSRFTDYGVNAAYQNAAQKQLGVKPATSDALLSNAIEQTAKDKASQLDLEGRLKTSELYSNHLQKNDDLRRNYAGMRMDVANRNKQSWAQLNMALSKNEAVRMIDNFTSLNNFIMEKRYNWAEDKQKSERYRDILSQNQMQRDSLARQESLLANYRRDYEKFGEGSEQWKEYGKNGYLQWLADTQPEAIDNIKKQIALFDSEAFRQNANENLRWYKLAKGGTISRKTDETDDKIWIQQNKDAALAVKLLNENIIKLLLKATT